MRRGKVEKREGGVRCGLACRRRGSDVVIQLTLTVLGSETIGIRPLHGLKEDEWCQCIARTAITHSMSQQKPPQRRSGEKLDSGIEHVSPSAPGICRFVTANGRNRVFTEGCQPRTSTPG